MLRVTEFATSNAFTYLAKVMHFSDISENNENPKRR